MPPAAPQMDQDAVNLAKAIRQTESGGNFNAKGASGESGAYQWMPDTWKKQAQDVLGDANAPMTPGNQNAVAYVTIKKLKDQGLNAAQIAATWNSGSPDGWENKVGTNSAGVHYDVPKYVKSVTDAYQTIKQGGQVASDPNNPSSTASPQSNALLQNGNQNSGSDSTGLLQSPNSSSNLDTQIQQLTSAPANGGNTGILGEIGNGAKAVGNFLFPAVGDIYHDIKGDNTKTGLQQLGDVGSTALGAATLIPGLDVFAGGAEAARAAELGGEVASKAAPGLLSAVGKNAALGAGFGVSGALGQGETDPTKIAEGGLIGGVTGGALGAAGKYASDALSKTAGTTAETRLGQRTNRLKTLTKAFKDNSVSASTNRAATDPITTMSQNGLTKLLKVEGGKVDANALTNIEKTGALDNMIEEHSDQATSLVKGMDGVVPINEFEDNVMRDIAQNPEIRDAGGVSKAQAEARRIFADYRESFGDAISYEQVNNIRARMNRIYDPETRDVARTIGDTARNYLYNGNGANTALKSLMQNEGELIRARNFAEKLHGTSVPGGQLGKYFADLVGAGIGGAAGSMFGPFGEAVGTGVGGYATHKIGGLLQGRYFNPMGTKTAGLLKKGLDGIPGKLAKTATLRGASQVSGK